MEEVKLTKNNERTDLRLQRQILLLYQSKKNRDWKIEEERKKSKEGKEKK